MQMVAIGFLLAGPAGDKIVPRVHDSAGIAPALGLGADHALHRLGLFPRRPAAHRGLRKEAAAGFAPAAFDRNERGGRKRPPMAAVTLLAAAPGSSISRGYLPRAVPARQRLDPRDDALGQFVGRLRRDDIAGEDVVRRVAGDRHVHRFARAPPLRQDALRRVRIDHLVVLRKQDEQRQADRREVEPATARTSAAIGTSAPIG